MMVDDLSEVERDLIVHAAAMGGWLSALGMTGSEVEAMHWLGPDCRTEVVFEHVPSGPERYRLTEVGWRIAAQLRDGSRA